MISIDDITQWASSMWNSVANLPEEVKAKYSEGVALMDRLAKTQKDLDGKIESLPDGPDKQRLSEERDRNRGLFESEVVPAWQKVREILGDPSTQSTSGSMGIVPVIVAGVAIAAITAWIYVTKRQVDLEEQLMKDPALLRAKYGSDTSFQETLKMGLMAVAALSGIYLLSGFMRKQR